MTKRKVATLEDIAREAGVTAVTVSNILNNRTRAEWPSVAERARRVREIAERLNYRPNMSARGMRSGRFNTVALVNRETVTEMPIDMVEGIHRRLEEKGLRLLMNITQFDEQVEIEHFSQLTKQNVIDGALLNAVSYFPESVAEEFSRCNVPVIWLNNNFHFNAVYPDDRGGAMRLCRHFVKQGAKRLFYLSVSDLRVAGMPRNQRHFSVAERIEGLEAVAEEASLPSGTQLLRGCVEDGATVRQARAFAGQMEPGDAVMTHNPIDASLVHSECARRGLSDVTQIGTFGSGAARRLLPEIVFMEHPWRTIGEIAVDRLLERIEIGGGRVDGCRVTYGEPRSGEVY